MSIDILLILYILVTIPTMDSIIVNGHIVWSRNIGSNKNKCYYFERKTANTG